ncbi:peptidylprolyl isomerase [Candidatus Thioglobus autotrophicus]|uniref:peptidylprolyl isomerase n=1 Tax=Candidatus Thioglobus autotrophicus TaxID=1705394 RepID=UPI00299E6A02|nr:peptidylprolyl isomerase [Candidatus Thioglobus autotrophicus]WPE15759.1 peptidylprolyl isomerase [Candidatus Thioglobus autotrophicus]WPE18811.1 peptidylprolyl isomerase [Candidatus Thioglobus autotrophicus]
MNKLPLLALIISLSASAAPNSIIAIVNDHLITQDALALSGQDPVKNKLDAVNQQIDILLQMDKAEQLGVKPKAVAVNNMLKRVAKQNSLTLEQLQKRPEFGDIMASIQQKLSLNGLKELVTSKVKLVVSPAELDQALADNPSDTQTLETQIRIAQIAISSVDQTDSLLQSQDDLIKALLLDLSSQIQQGKTFAALARLHSQDESYKNGGESGWLVQERLPKDFIQVVQDLELQELSKPFKVGGGWRLIKVIEKRQIDMHLQSIKAALIRQKKNLYFRNWTKKLRKDAYIEIFNHKL